MRTSRRQRGADCPGGVGLDRGYDANTVRNDLAGRDITDTVITRKRRRGDAKPASNLQTLGMRWAVETRTNSWLSNFGQMRRNTDRFTAHRLAQLAVAITLLIAAKLIDWHNRWNRPNTPATGLQTR